MRQVCGLHQYVPGRRGDYGTPDRDRGNACFSPCSFNSSVCWLQPEDGIDTVEVGADHGGDGRRDAGKRRVRLRGRCIPAPDYTSSAGRTAHTAYHNHTVRLVQRLRSDVIWQGWSGHVRANELFSLNNLGKWLGISSEANNFSILHNKHSIMYLVQFIWVISMHNHDSVTNSCYILVNYSWKITDKKLIQSRSRDKIKSGVSKERACFFTLSFGPIIPFVRTVSLSPGIYMRPAALRIQIPIWTLSTIYFS